MLTTPCDRLAINEVRQLLNYLADNEGQRIITGQHTQAMGMEEVEYLHKVTGRKPALCGFELLAYSPNIDWVNSDKECLDEVLEAQGTIAKAYEWAEQGGLITFSWHWFSPIGGSGKSFFTKFTDFDVREALIEGTPENRAFCHDMDIMVEILRGFEQKSIPILWRPFHEAEGDWFWWGAHGTQYAADAFRYMFRYFTEKKNLHNLIWVWNCPLKEYYVGDEYCDIISRDLYPEKNNNNDYIDKYLELKAITPSDKGGALAETGVVPDVEKAIRTGAKWLWYMTWSHSFCIGGEYSSDDFMKRLYNSDKAITLDKLDWKGKVDNE